jgi:hypothetical protein
VAIGAVVSVLTRLAGGELGGDVTVSVLFVAEAAVMAATEARGEVQRER